MKKLKAEAQSPQADPVVSQLRQICRAREERVKQLGEDLGQTKLALQRAHDEVQSAAANKPETASVGCNTEEVLTREDSSGELPGAQNVRHSFSVHSEDLRGALPQQSAEPQGKMDQGDAWSRHVATSRSVPDSPSRRSLASTPQSRRPLSRSSSRGSHRLPPTPPTGDRTGSRARRNSASSR